MNETRLDEVISRAGDVKHLPTIGSVPGTEKRKPKNQGPGTAHLSQ